MPGIIIHLAAANEYLKNNPNEDSAEFLKGAIAPDYMPDPDKAHHSSQYIYDGALPYLFGKVNLKESIPDFDINTSFGKGYFYHLITDYVFYRSLLDKDADINFGNMSYDELRDMLYHDYAATNNYIKNQYNVVVPKIAEKYDVKESVDLKILRLDEICKMIRDLSSLDLNEYLKNL